ncbi:hypothetical protein C8K18_101807 [Paraburkholderia sp. GV068]|uniref:hypothetical protein n=1 Tax=unclassified Paraburkholderia TaxID=2615204 RepID=UPI000D32706E|nr:MULTISPECIES: hypothetical protein [unclassified Paraburkholderia]PTR04327.1 hypothetical protein C8K19_101732 [Paraburkholderia sp. GV072]PUB09284.1 hypothetical protein C8K18_101807 [Paraburkholderia sp. GV068]
MGFLGNLFHALTNPNPFKAASDVGKLLGIDPQAQADAIRQAAATQAAAEIQAANTQAEATRQASLAQTAMLNQQAQAAAQAQQATINQTILSNKIAAMQTQQPQTQIDLTSSTVGDGSDPRRRYMGNGAGSSVGASSGGMGIRLT